MKFKTIFSAISFLVLLLNCSGGQLVQAETGDGYSYSGATMYEPFQPYTTYEQPPQGYEMVFTQIISRHGARAITSGESCDTFLGYLKTAGQSGGLTTAGAALQGKITAFKDINANVGFGNLNENGQKQLQGMGARYVESLSQFFTKATNENKPIRSRSSGVTRATDSGRNFHIGMKEALTGLASIIDDNIAIDPYLLHFSWYDQYYKNYLKNDATYLGKVAAIQYSDESYDSASSLLQSMFTPSYISSLEKNDCVDIAFAFYELFMFVPSLNAYDLGLSDYITPEQSASQAFLYDMQAFYRNGPGFNTTDITYANANVLLHDFMQRIRDIINKDLRMAASLNFAHAETIVPFAALLGLPRTNVSLSPDEDFTYEKTGFYGNLVTPFAANIRWDVYSNSENIYLVKLYYNEAEIPFKEECNPIQGGSFFYDFTELERCYGYQ